ncbi:MAG: hypothetical protein U9M95_00630 [Candidatus Altiarchaeota archaeon]|nr:hypothetical protein [Candidatus Altiarchaeota archaeon]
MRELLLIHDYGGKDFQFPALKHRLESFRKFRYSPRGRKLELEGIFIYRSASPLRKPDSYIGYLDPREEYKLLGLKPPQENLKIWCHIPSDLATREKLISKPNIRVTGRVVVNMDKTSTKHIVVDELEYLPITYKAVGAPAFENLEDMFTYIYSRTPEMYEQEPMLLLASLIGSEKRDIIFPRDNPGCGVNIGVTREKRPGELSGHIIREKDIDRFKEFIRRVSVEPIDKLNNNLMWGRFMSQKIPENVLSRRVYNSNEINWNLSTLIEDINKGWKKRNKFMSSDLNMPFEPDIAFPRISKEDAKNLKQTILFAKSTPSIEYTGKIEGIIEAKTDDLIRELAEEATYAPFLFRYRLAPLCDAFIKGNHLADYLMDDNIRFAEKEIRLFFRHARSIAIDFIDFSKQHIDPKYFDDILEDKSPTKKADNRFLGLCRELQIKGYLSYPEIMSFLIERYTLTEKKAESIIDQLRNHEPAIVIEKDNGLSPIY